MLQQIFRRKDLAPLLTLDIHDSEIRFLMLDSDQQFKRPFIQSLAPHAVVEHRIQQPDIVIDALQKGMQHMPSYLKQAAISLPDYYVITKTLKLDPFLTDHDVENVLLQEIGNDLAFSLEDLQYDYYIHRDDETNEIIDVTFVAAQREIIRFYENILTDAQLKLRLVDVASYTVARTAKWLLKRMQRWQSNETFWLIFIDENYLQSLFLRNNQVLLHREELISLEQFQKKFFLIEPKAAAVSALSKTLTDELAQRDFFYEAIIERIAGDLQMFNLSFPNKAPKQCLVMMAENKAFKLSEMIQRRFEVATEFANFSAFFGRSTDLFQQEKNYIKESFVRCIGLGLRETLI